MHRQPPTTQTMMITDVKLQFDHLVNRVRRQQTRVVVEQGGTPVAGLVSAQDLERLDRLDQQWAEDTKALDEFAAGFADQSPEEIERETAKALAEVRAEMRAERQWAEGTKALKTFGAAFADGPVEEQEREVARAIAAVRAVASARGAEEPVAVERQPA